MCESFYVILNIYVYLALYVYGRFQVFHSRVVLWAWYHIFGYLSLNMRLNVLMLLSEAITDQSLIDFSNTLALIQ